jgi:hypothetical protein
VADHDSSRLPDGARRLLIGPVDSFEKIYLIVTLHRAETPQGLDALETSTGAPTTILQGALEQLAASGLVAQQAGCWRLAPDRDVTAIDELVAAWTSSRTAVLNLITYRSLERIRSSAARTFADAFRLRGGGRTDRGESDG